jgi:hypothetical protein
VKYPLDPKTFIETMGQLVEHEKSQTVLIGRMTTLLEEAMDAAPNANDNWYMESEELLKDFHSLAMYHESRRFNEANFQAQMPKDMKKMVAKTKFMETLDDIEDIIEESEEEEIGEMTEDELSRHFKEKRVAKQNVASSKKLKDMSLEEIQDWERAQDNSNDLYKIKARVANIARGGNMVLTPQGEMLANTYVHVLKSLYDFAEKIEDKNIRIQLVELIRSHEGMPGNLIAAAGAGVTIKK